MYLNFNVLTDTLMTEINKQHTKIAAHYNLNRRSDALRNFYKTIFPTGVRHLMLSYLQDRIDRIQDPEDEGSQVGFTPGDIKLPSEERKIMPKILERIAGLSDNVVYYIMNLTAVPYFEKDPKNGPIRSGPSFKLYANSTTYSVLHMAEQVSEKFKFSGNKLDRLVYEEDITDYYLPSINASIEEIAQAITEDKFRGMDGCKVLDLEEEVIRSSHSSRTN